MRVDNDNLGDVSVPVDALYSTNVVRALQNFGGEHKPLSGFPHFIETMARVKQASAHANRRLEVISGEVASAISKACDEVIAGEHRDHFIVPLMEASGGTSINMNFNEVIASRAGQILGDPVLGKFSRVHPNDHVNRGQSTNDVLPTAIKLCCFGLSHDLVQTGLQLVETLRGQAATHRHVLRLGRTCMQAAQPMTYGQLFDGYASSVERAVSALDRVRDDLRVVPMGATAIGTGLGAAPGFRRQIANTLTDCFGFKVSAPADYFDAMQSADGFSRLSSELNILANTLAKIASDLVILSSDDAGGLGEVRLPSVQPGSSIMAGKINPVMCMMVQQSSFIVAGNHQTVSLAALHGQMEINHFEPVIAAALFSSLSNLRNTLDKFNHRCVAGIEIDEARSYANLKNSSALSTVFVDSLGYKTVANLVARSNLEGVSFSDIAIAEKLLTPQALRASLDAAAIGNIVTPDVIVIE